MSESEDDDNFGRFNFEDILTEQQIISDAIEADEEENDPLLPNPLMCSLGCRAPRLPIGNRVTKIGKGHKLTSRSFLSARAPLP
jgi:hypothetical protein